MAAIENELQVQLNSQITNLHLVERLLTLAPRIDSRQFAAFAAQTLTPGVHTLEWVPRVAEVDRAEFEAAASAGGERFRILEPTGSGALIEAPAAAGVLSDSLRRAAADRQHRARAGPLDRPGSPGGDVACAGYGAGHRDRPGHPGRRPADPRGHCRGAGLHAERGRGGAHGGGAPGYPARVRDVGAADRQHRPESGARGGHAAAGSVPPGRERSGRVRADLHAGHPGARRRQPAGQPARRVRRARVAPRSRAGAPRPVAGRDARRAADAGRRGPAHLPHRTLRAHRGRPQHRRRRRSAAPHRRVERRGHRPPPPRSAGAGERGTLPHHLRQQHRPPAERGRAGRLRPGEPGVEAPPRIHRRRSQATEPLRRRGARGRSHPGGAAAASDSRRAGGHLRRDDAVQGRPPRGARRQRQRAHPGGRAARHPRHLPRRHHAQDRRNPARHRPRAPRPGPPRLEARAVGPRCRGRARLPQRGLGHDSRHRAPRRRGADRVAHCVGAPGRSPRDYRRGLCRAQGRAAGIPGRAPGADGQRPLEVDPVARHGHRARCQRARQAHDRHQRRHRRAEARRRGHGGGRAPPPRGHRRPARCRLPVPVVRRQPGPVQLPQRRRPGTARRRPRGGHPRAAPGLRRDRQGRPPRLSPEPPRRDHRAARSSGRTSSACCARTGAWCGAAASRAVSAPAAMRCGTATGSTSRRSSMPSARCARPATPPKRPTAPRARSWRP